MIARMHQGYTLLETLIVISIIAILGAFAVPVFTDFIALERFDRTVNTVSQSIEFAHTTSVATNQIITFCGSSDGTHCDGAWQQEMIVFPDPSGQRIVSDSNH